MTRDPIPEDALENAFKDSGILVDLLSREASRLKISITNKPHTRYLENVFSRAYERGEHFVGLAEKIIEDDVELEKKREGRGSHAGIAI